MKNPFKKSCKGRGLPDTGFHHGYPQHQQTNNTSTLNPGSSSAPSSSSSSSSNFNSNMVSDPIIPEGYPCNSNYSHNNHPHNVDPPIAHPYAAQPDEDVSTGPVFEFNAGDNRNEKGQQRGGNIRAANAVAGSGPAISFPKNGRFVINTGKNYNVGEVQENGNVEFGNVG